MHAVNRGLSKISPWNYIINKLSKLRSHLVYIAPRNNAQIWINSDIWLSFSHRLFRAAVMWQMHVINKPSSFVLCSFQIIEPAVFRCAWFYCLLRSYKSILQLCGLSEHVDVAFTTNQKWVWLLSDCYVLWKVLVQAMRGVFQESCEYIYIQCFLYTHNMLLRRLNIRHMRNKWRVVNIYILPPVRQF